MTGRGECLDCGLRRNDDGLGGNDEGVGAMNHASTEKSTPVRGLDRVLRMGLDCGLRRNDDGLGAMWEGATNGECRHRVHGPWRCGGSATWGRRRRPARRR